MNYLNEKTILIVNTGSIKKRFILQHLKKMNLNIVCLNKEKNWAQPYVDHWILADNANHTESLNALKEFLSFNKIDGVLTFWEDDVLLTSKIVDKFNFLGISYNIAKKVRNKLLFRKFCQEQGLPFPNFKLIKSTQDINNLDQELKFPLVIKPAFGASSAYVVKVNSQEELLQTYHYIKKNISIRTESALSDGLDVFVEEYIEGDEVDVDIILQNGKIKFYSISDNYQTKEPFFIETGRATPSTLSQKTKTDIINLAEETLEKLNVQNGVIHFEAKANPKQPVPIEINLRMGGDEIYSSTKEAWDIDLIESAVQIALGVYIPKKAKLEIPKKYMVGKDFLSDYSGILSKLEINPEIHKERYLEEIHFFKKVGDAVLVPPEGYDYLGWITVSGFSASDAQENLCKALKYISYEVAKFTPASSIGKTSRKSKFTNALLNSNLLVHAVKIEKLKKTEPAQQKNLHVGIACNVFNEGNNAVEKELMFVGKNIETTLQERGYKTTFFDFNNVRKIITQLNKTNIDIMFNVCERINDSSLLEPHAAAILDVLQIPYTGSNPTTLALCIDKIKVKKLLNYHNIPTPKWDYLYSIDDPIDSTLHFPLIIKPANTDNSIGITNESVVNTKEELNRQLKKVILDLKSPALIEEFIEGDEYDVSILGSEDENLRVLPLQRSIFKEMPLGSWHIYTHEAKFGKKSLNDLGIMVQYPPKNINIKLQKLLTEIALDTYNILDCHDYGRVEIRVDKDDNPYVLELNPNPSINKGDCVPKVAEITGMNYGDFLEEIIAMAIKRYKNQPSYYHLLNNII